MPLEYSEASGHSLQQPLPGCIENISNKKITMWQMTNAANTSIWRCFTPHNFCASTQQFIWQGMLHSCQVKSAQDVGKINRENWKSSILDWSKNTIKNQLRQLSRTLRFHSKWMTFKACNSTTLTCNTPVFQDNVRHVYYFQFFKNAFTYRLSKEP